MIPVTAKTGTQPPEADLRSARNRMLPFVCQAIEDYAIMASAEAFL